MLMMQMIQQLAACKSYDFSGWFLAEASLCLEGKGPFVFIGDLPKDGAAGRAASAGMG